MESIRKELLPGVVLRAIQTDKFKSAVLGVTLMSPLTQKTASEHALIPMVLRRGTKRYPDMERLSAALDELYGGAIEPSVRRRGETQCVGFTASFLDDACTLDGAPLLERATALLGELLLCPAGADGFIPEYVTGERANLIDRIRAQKNDKMMYAIHRMNSLMCQGEAYGVDRLGDEEHAARITPESLWARYQALLAESEIVLFYCGSAAPARVEAAFAEALRGLPRAKARAATSCQVIATARTVPPREFTERMDVTQGKLTLGFRTGGATIWEENYPALLVFNAAYGASTNSKLFNHVRERLSLCYYAGSMIERMKGIMLVYSGVDFSKFDAARDEILAQLEACRRGELDGSELESARAFVLNDLRATLDTQGRLEDYWLTNEAAGVDLAPERLAEQAMAVTAEQIAAVARGLELDGIYYLTGKDA